MALFFYTTTFRINNYLCIPDFDGLVIGSTHNILSIILDASQSAQMPLVLADTLSGFYMPHFDQPITSRRYDAISLELHSIDRGLMRHDGPHKLSGFHIPNPDRFVFGARDNVPLIKRDVQNASRMTLSTQSQSVRPTCSAHASSTFITKSRRTGFWVRKSQTMMLVSEDPDTIQESLNCNANTLPSCP